jgi:hypothetical protein
VLRLLPDCAQIIAYLQNLTCVVLSVRRPPRLPLAWCSHNAAAQGLGGGLADAALDTFDALLDAWLALAELPVDPPPDLAAGVAVRPPSCL